MLAVVTVFIYQHNIMGLICTYFLIAREGGAMRQKYHMMA